MPYASLEARKEHDKNPVRLAKKAAKKKTRREQDEEFRTRDNARKAQWQLENPKKCNSANSVYRANIKLEVLTHYGPRETLGCCWEDCVVVDIDMLSLDHVNDDGNKHVDSKGKRISGDRVYRWTKNSGYPTNFQTLCMNHQQKKKLAKVRNDKGVS